jgi:hypothetical protein
MLRFPALIRRNPADAQAEYDQALASLERTAAARRVASDRRLGYDCAETREHYDMCDELHFLAQYRVRRAQARLHRHAPQAAGRPR